MIKAPTGIIGLDDVTTGGLPSGRTTLIEGSAGSGKTILALQNLAHGIRECGEPGIFVAFEENSRRLVANAETFGWQLQDLEPDRLFFLDAQPDPNLIQSGSFDLEGLLAVLDAKVKAMGARRLVFDGIDVVLVLLDGPHAVRREIYRVYNWLLERELTAIITAKAAPGYDAGIGIDLLEYLQFMVDCSVTLSHDLREGISQRSLRIRKYRGSTFDENATPVVIGPAGLEVASTRGPNNVHAKVTSERISSGIERLDTMLGGGYYRGAGILLTGSPGTAKTTLCGAFAAAACGRGEKTLFVSFDSFEDEVVRNLRSVGNDLAPFLKSDLLRTLSASAIRGSAELHLLRIKQMSREHGARCVIVDPVSALAKSGNNDFSLSVTERLVDWAKLTGVTLLFTSLLDHGAPLAEGTPLQVSTIADTWIHLSYIVRAGERNRALSIVKSRGTDHSNQVRELMLSAEGVTLADVYTADGEVLMGTLRWAKERAERLSKRERGAEIHRQKFKLEAEVAELEARAKILQLELGLRRGEVLHLSEVAERGGEEQERAHEDMRTKRGADEGDSNIGSTRHE